MEEHASSFRVYERLCQHHPAQYSARPDDRLHPPRNRCCDAHRCGAPSGRAGGFRRNPCGGAQVHYKSVSSGLEEDMARTTASVVSNGWSTLNILAVHHGSRNPCDQSTFKRAVCQRSSRTWRLGWCSAHCFNANGSYLASNLNRARFWRYAGNTCRTRGSNKRLCIFPRSRL